MRKIERSMERGKSELGWLHSRFTYSFAEYFNPERMGFGVLRVVNDDVVEPRNGFPLHHHEQMEIVTIMLAGVLTHEDSMGNKKELRAGEVQVMTAGTGVNHSEWNHGDTEVRLFQIWIYPKERALIPRYDQRGFTVTPNTLTPLVSGIKHENTLFIHQEAIFSRALLEKGKSLLYKKEKTERGIFIMVISGNIKVGEDVMSERDTIEIVGEDDVHISGEENADMLIIEVPGV